MICAWPPGCGSVAKSRGFCGRHYRTATRAGLITAGLVDATPARDHIAELVAGGWSQAEIARTARLNVETVRRIQRGTPRVRIGVEQKVLSINPRKGTR